MRLMTSIRLLVATHDWDLLVSLLIFLREEASLHVVGTASDPPSLLALIGSTRPEVVLVDEMLIADKDAKLAQVLASSEWRPRLLVMTANENSIPSTSLADALVLKYAPPAVLLDRLKQAVE